MDTEKKEKESEVAQSCPTLCHPMDCSLLHSSVHGILQARILKWVAISFSRGSSQPRDQTWVSRIVGRQFTVWATSKNIDTEGWRYIQNFLKEYAWWVDLKMSRKWSFISFLETLIAPHKYLSEAKWLKLECIYLYMHTRTHTRARAGVRGQHHSQATTSLSWVLPIKYFWSGIRAGPLKFQA